MVQFMVLSARCACHVEARLAEVFAKTLGAG